MDETAIKIENVSLSFMVSLDRSSRGGVKSFFSTLGNKIFSMTDKHNFLALDRISFNIKKGELVGVIGRNGAGKTTLARVMAGIYTPSKGRVLVSGTLNALFSLGGGFQQNLELSGRENIYNYCAYLGYTRSEIKRIIDNIIEFSELGEFINAPVKMYSTGMKGRLVFSAAIYLKPDIVILDEVLSAGDPSFQNKAGNILDIFKSQGATIVFVSHSLEIIRQHCKRIIWLDNGRLKMDGLSSDVLPQYKNFIGKVKGAVRNIDGEN